MAGEPNELPEGGEGGGGGIWGGWRGEYPAELPVGIWQERAVTGLLREVLVMRARVQRLENAQIAAAVLGRGAAAAAWGVGGPNELPEGGEGGGGGGGWHGEFPGEIAELPIDRTILQTIAELENRFTIFEAKVVATLERLEVQVQKLGG